MSGELVALRIKATGEERFGPYALARFEGRDVELTIDGRVLDGRIVETVDRDGGRAVDIHIVLPDGDDMTQPTLPPTSWDPADRVHVFTGRPGVEYHAYASVSATVCGRETGTRMGRAITRSTTDTAVQVAERFYLDRPCPRCFPPAADGA